MAWRWLLLAWLVPSSAMATPAEELLAGGHVRVRVHTEPVGQVVRGQQTRLFVDILTDTWFTSAPRYPELRLEGAISLMPERLGTNFTESIDRVTFAAQRRSYVIFPQRTGRLEIPPLQIWLGVSRDGEASPPFAVTTPPVTLRVVAPAGAEEIQGLVTTPSLTVREVWEPPTGDLRVGDALRRTVRLSADRSLGMLLPELAFSAPRGIAVYPDQPRVLDHVNRGRYRGERVETVTYVLQRPGSYTLPPIEIHWWDPGSGRLMTETLEEHSFEVGGAVPGSFFAPASGSGRALLEGLLRTWRWARAHWILLLCVLVGLLVAQRRLRHSLPRAFAWLGRERERRRHSESHDFRQLDRSLRQGDLDAVVRDYWCWRGHWVAGASDPTDMALRRAAATSGFAEAWATLERNRYGSAGDAADTEILRNGLRALRAALRSSPSELPATDLLDLNPR